MRGRILSGLLPRSSISPRLQTCRNFENGAEKSARALNFSNHQSTNSQVSEVQGSSAPEFLHQNFGLSSHRRTISSFQPIRCPESSAFRVRTSSSSSPSRSEVEAQRRSFVARGKTEKDVRRICWACEHEVSSGNGLFCPSCDAIQPLDLSVDHFRIFGIERSFKLDSKLLEQKYKNLQKKLHPDLMSSKSQKEQGYSAEQSSHVIQAYYTLLRPLSRARYLLVLDGIRVDEERTIDDPALLMEIMEIRESLEDVSDAEELQKLQTQNHSRIRDTQKVLETTFAAGDLEKAVSWVQRLGYYFKVDEEIIRKL